MTVSLMLFAAARETVGEAQLEIQLPSGATVADLRAELLRRYPRLANLMQHTRFAVNNDYASETTVLADGSDVACIPPVSGG